MEFNHESKSIAEALGMSESHLAELSGKLSEIAIEVVTAGNKKPSHIAQKLAEELSYSELIFVATQYLAEKINDFEEQRKDMLSSILKKILRDLEKE